MFTQIPTARPDTPLLNRIDDPHQLRQLSSDQLAPLCAELRHFLLYSVGQTGGHLGAGLGAEYQTPCITQKVEGVLCL